MRCPIVFRGPNRAVARVAAQHSQNYGSWHAHVPGLIVHSVDSAADAKGLLKAAIRTDDRSSFSRTKPLDGSTSTCRCSTTSTLPIGKARIVRPGKDVTIVSYSIGVGVALEAAQELVGQGISAEVIDLRTLTPLDKATVLESLEAHEPHGRGRRRLAGLLDQLGDHRDRDLREGSTTSTPRCFGRDRRRRRAAYAPTSRSWR